MDIVICGAVGLVVAGFVIMLLVPLFKRRDEFKGFQNDLARRHFEKENENK